VPNTATVSGGGEINTGNNTANDITTIGPGPDLTITKSHTGYFPDGGDLHGDGDELGCRADDGAGSGGTEREDVRGRGAGPDSRPGHRRPGAPFQSFPGSIETRWFFPVNR
jgi:hypothetical protein